MFELFGYLFENPGRVLYLTMEHIFLFGVSTGIACMIGLTGGIAASLPGRERTGRWILTLSGAAQAVPSIAVIALIYLGTGDGALPALIALVLYSLVPVLFNTVSGVLSVPPDLVYAGRSLGYTDRQLMFRVQLPTAAPVIMAGVRNAAVINVGAATVASFIGGGGLGDLIFMGIKLYRPDMIFAGALLCALLAFIADALLALLERMLTPRGLRLTAGERGA